MAALMMVVGRKNTAISEGKFYELMVANQHSEGFNERIYLYLRYTGQQRNLVAVNFNRHPQAINIKLPDDLMREFELSGEVTFTDLLSDAKCTSANMAGGLPVTLPAMGGMLLEF
jgi:hypothetical protein